MKKVFLIMMLVLPKVLNAGSVGFEKAKMLADESERNLNTKQLDSLIKAQAKIAGNAFPECIKITRVSPRRFTVIVELDEVGRVKQSWINGEQSFARCFESIMVDDFVYKPPFLPFSTAFDYKAE